VLLPLLLMVSTAACARRGGGGDHGGGASAGAGGGAELAIVGECALRTRDEALPARSPLFDGTRVRLRGARGETVALQVRTRGHAAPARLELPAPLRVQAFALQWLNVREPSTGMYGPSRGAGAYADPLRPSAQPVAGDALFDVAIPISARPGTIAGKLIVGGRSFEVVVDIEPMAIDLDDDPLVWIWYLPAEIARAHRLADDDRVLLPLERRYHALARAHGAYLASDVPLERFVARQELMRGVRYWPVAIDVSSEESARAEAEQWSNQFAKRPQTAFTIPVDEPQAPQERARARQAGERIGKHDKLLRAVTAAPTADLTPVMDVFLGPTSRPPHRWTYNGTPPAAGGMIIDGAGPGMRSWGWIAARYGVELWHAWEGTYFADRYNKGGPTDVFHDPLTFDQRRRGARSPDWGNGDGVLFYPGSDGPWPSLRLKMLRRGLQDRLLLRALERCGAADVATAVAHELVPRALDEGRGAAAWPADDDAWEAARTRLYDSGRTRCARATSQ
jgi:hypothetical protein